MENLNKMIEKLTDCARAELDKGIESIDAEEMGKVTDMIKDLSEASYYCKVTKAMDEYEDNDTKGYRGQPRNEHGQFKADGRPNKGYEPEQRLSDMRNPEMMKNKEYSRGYSDGHNEGYSKGFNDGSTHGYTRGYDSAMSNNTHGYNGNSGGGTSGYSNNTSSGTNGYDAGYSRGFSDGRRDSERNDSRYTQSRRRYMDSKKNNADKQTKNMELDNAMKDLTDDLREMIMGAEMDEKQIVKRHLQNLINAM